jgi:hypothetical protein
MLVTPNLLPYFATMELAFKRDVPYFIFFSVLFFLLSFWREKAIFGIGTGWSLCHLVKKKCDAVPTA